MNLGPVVNSAYDESYLSLSPDGLLLLFSDFGGPPWSTPRPGGYGGCDMWMTRRKNISSSWQVPVNLGAQVNGPEHTIIPRISLDGSMLYFITNSDGTWDNWQVPIIPIVDFNGDGKVDGKDVLCTASQWGTNDSLCDIGPFAWGDGIVDLQDVIALAEYIGKEVTDPALVAHWAFDETEGATACDSAGTHNGFVIGYPLWQPTGGQVDGALQFDGVLNCISTNFILDPAQGPFSVLAWVKGGGPGQVIVSQPNGADWLKADAAGNLMTELKSPNWGAAYLVSLTNLTDGEWHRIGLVWDGSRRMLYADGVVVAEDAQQALASSSNGLYIGTGSTLQPGTFWSGLIDDVRIYNRAVRP